MRLPGHQAARHEHSAPVPCDLDCICRLECGVDRSGSVAKMKLALHDGHEAAGLRGFTQCNINETVQGGCDETGFLSAVEELMPGFWMRCCAVLLVNGS